MIRRIRVPALAILLLLGWLLSGCGRAEPRPLLFEEAPWTSGEQHTLTLTDADGQQVGSAVYTLTGVEDSTGAAAWGFDREIVSLGTQEVVTVTMDAKGFRPQASHLLRSDGNGQESVDALYTSGQVDMTLATRENVVTVQREQVPSDSRETVTLPMLLRALPLEKGYATQINTFMPIAAQLERVNVSVVDEESVTTEGGTYLTWVVELDAGDSVSKAWIGKESPHLLVKYLDGRNKATLALVEYRPGTGQ